MMSHAAGQSTRPAIPKSTPPRVAKSTTPLTRLFPNNVRGRISAFIVRESRRMRNGIGILYYTLAHGHGQTATGSTASDVGRGDRSADGREPPLRRRGELLRATVCASLRDRRPPPHTCPWPRKRSEAAGCSCTPAHSISVSGCGRSLGSARRVPFRAAWRRSRPSSLHSSARQMKNTRCINY